MGLLGWIHPGSEEADGAAHNRCHQAEDQECLHVFPQRLTEGLVGHRRDDRREREVEDETQTEDDDGATQHRQGATSQSHVVEGAHRHAGDEGVQDQNQEWREDGEGEEQIVHEEPGEQ